jgi:hypothetical protein
VGECGQQGLPARPDPLTAPPEKVADPAHAIVDFNGVSKSQCEAKGARLARGAVARGRLYAPDDPAPGGEDEGVAR